MPTIVIPAEMSTPTVARTTITGRSRRSSFQRRWKAASKMSGGRSPVKISSLVRLIFGAKGSSARPIPAATNPTL